MVLCQALLLFPAVHTAMSIGVFNGLPLLRRQVIAWSAEFTSATGTAVFMVALGIFVILRTVCRDNAVSISLIVPLSIGAHMCNMIELPGKLCRTLLLPVDIIGQAACMNIFFMLSMILAFVCEDLLTIGVVACACLCFEVFFFPFIFRTMIGFLLFFMCSIPFMTCLKQTAFIRFIVCFSIGAEFFWICVRHGGNLLLLRMVLMSVCGSLVRKQDVSMALARCHLATRPKEYNIFLSIGTV